MEMGQVKWKNVRLYRVAVGLSLTILAVGLFWGCSQGSASPPNSQAASILSSDISSEATSSHRKAADGTRTITDMMGNRITVPDEIRRVYCSSPIGTDFLYTLAPETLLGWSWAMSDEEKKYILSPYKDLPVLGGNMAGQNSINTETVIKLKPDIILDFAHEGQVGEAVKKLSEQTGIPIVEAPSDLDRTEECYRFFGDLLNRKDRGDQLADYVRDSLARTKAVCEKVPAGQRMKLYYSESADGLKTDGTDSMHTEVIDFVRAINVVDMKTTAMANGTAVSMEQVLAWNPEVILLNRKMGGDEFLKSVYSDPKWAAVSAVRNKRIYTPVSVPFNWFDRPPSVARVLGVQWLASALYPDTVKIDLKSEIQKFYQLFYQAEVSGEQAEALLKASGVGP
ncbi:ABC transporter substrate-binding protein [Caproicibacter fermentans]|nr:ABC transporter substrate-binding protein [Caproicibacter fermentans]